MNNLSEIHKIILVILWDKKQFSDKHIPSLKQNDSFVF